MKNIIAFLLVLSLTPKVYTQFLEFSPLLQTNCIVSGKDYHNFLYGTKSNTIYRVQDDSNLPWQPVYEHSQVGIEVVVTDLFDYPRYAYSQSGQIFRSLDGSSFILHTFSGISGTISKLEYLDNGELIVFTNSKTFVSNNGGNTFVQLLNEPITAIKFDAFSNKYIFIKRPTNTTSEVRSLDKSSGTNSLIESGITVTEYSKDLLSISKDGTFYYTCTGAFEYIYEFLGGVGPARKFYPMGTDYPLHTRALVSSKTGRTWIGSWGFGLYAIQDDTLHYNHNRPEMSTYNCENIFLDKHGYLYYSYSTSNVIQNYIKSAYSVRQSVYFERMEQLESDEYSGYFVRTSDNKLLCAKLNGNLYFSNDDGDSWQYNQDLIPSTAAQFLSFSKHPSGRLISGNSFGQCAISEDSGLTWQNSTALAGKLMDVAYTATGDKTLLIYDNGVALSTDSLQTKSPLYSITTTHPTYGTIAQLKTGLITSTGTFLVGGHKNASYINRSTDNGQTWTEVLPAGIYHQKIWDLIEDHQNTIWLASDSGIYLSQDDGLTFTKDLSFNGAAHFFTLDGQNRIVVTDQAPTSNTGSTYVMTESGWKRISYGHNRGMDYLYYDPVTALIYGGGAYRGVSTGDQDVLSLHDDLETDYYLENKDELVIYPNPVNDYFMIANYENSNVPVIVYDQQGNVIFSEQSSNGTIQTKELKSGLYFVSVQTSNGLKYGKFVKY